ncbi:mitochondrial pyruvate carrier 4 isoform X1 [Gossypium hirsutum]|uniref:Mitochondrial pyruvate carrier n=1 Tax=Gossypium hirsutum TaxID=3635 RepID=A0ABM3AUQ0_GOSHI|nr:mitochondrial pyruvate carrier 4-like isoform X1 [Gossypium hirsutum]
MASSKLQALWNHPAGPKTIHFWAPTFKWGISIANVADFTKPPEKLSYPQQIGNNAYCVLMYLLPVCCKCLTTSYSTLILASLYLHVFEACLIGLHLILTVFSSFLSVIFWYTAVTCTGVIWSRYSTVITPKNWNLFSVNIVMAGTGLYQLAQKIQHDFFSEAETEPAIAKE